MVPGSSTTMDAAVMNRSLPTSPKIFTFTAAPRSDPPTVPSCDTVTVPDENTLTLPVTDPLMIRSPVKMVRSPLIVPSTTPFVDVTYTSSLTGSSTETT
jgi:hypothetical protein